jgi:NitT/TauT family transport system substrate-binding protein
MNENPGIIEEERAQRSLLADQPTEILAEVVPFYTEGTKEGLFDPKGGGEKAAKSDVEFYTEAGQLEGAASELKVEDYWDLGPLTRAAAKLGG